MTQIDVRKAAAFVLLVVITFEEVRFEGELDRMRADLDRVEREHKDHASTMCIDSDARVTAGRADEKARAVDDRVDVEAARTTELERKWER